MAKIVIGNVKGKDGRGIKEIVKTASTGAVDTYTITYTDNTTSTFTINNSNSISLQRQIVPSAAVESSATASQAYAAGDYVVVSGVLRKVTAAIAKGNTISDSNSTATTVTGELATLRDSVSRAFDESEKKYLYRNTNGSSYVFYRRVGIIVEMFWQFNQDNTQVWKAGTLMEGYRPHFGFLEPALLCNQSGIVSNNTAEVEVTAAGEVNFVCAAGIAGGRIIGHCVWIAA
nr:MAG TPA: hypothetical protein [Caudoviricetes sp.]